MRRQQLHRLLIPGVTVSCHSVRLSDTRVCFYNHSSAFSRSLIANILLRCSTVHVDAMVSERCDVSVTAGLDCSEDVFSSTLTLNATMTQSTRAVTFADAGPAYQVVIHVLTAGYRYYVTPPTLAGLLATIGGFVGSMLGLHGLLRTIFTFIHRHVVAKTTFFGIFLFFMPLFMPFNWFGVTQSYGLLVGSAICCVLVGFTLSPVLYLQFLERLGELYQINVEKIQQNAVLTESDIVSSIVCLVFFGALLIIFATIRYRNQTGEPQRPPGGVGHLIAGFCIGLISVLGLTVVVLAGSVGKWVPAPVELGAFHGTALSPRSRVLCVVVRADGAAATQPSQQLRHLR